MADKKPFQTRRDIFLKVQVPPLLCGCNQPSYDPCDITGSARTKALVSSFPKNLSALVIVIWDI